MLKNKKYLGQNWLKDRQILLTIAQLASTADDARPAKTAQVQEAQKSNVAPTDAACAPLALEIGPGLGTLTSALFKFFTQVIAVEIDKDLAQKLPASLPGKNLKVISGDFLDLSLAEMLGANYKNMAYIVVGNIPYYISAPIIRKCLSLRPKPEKIVFLLQKEVAQRLAAKPGNYSVLALETQYQAEVTLGPSISRQYFTPVPKVDSQVVILKPKTGVGQEPWQKLIKAAFLMPRKKLVNNLKRSGIKEEKILLALKNIGLDAKVRPADLSLEDWDKLAQQLGL